MSESLACIGFIAYIKSNIRVIALFIVGKHKQSTEKRQVSCCKDCARQVSLACRPQFQWGEAYGVSRRERTPVERRWGAEHWRSVATSFPQRRSQVSVSPPDRERAFHEQRGHGYRLQFRSAGQSYRPRERRRQGFGPRSRRSISRAAWSAAEPLSMWVCAGAAACRSIRKITDPMQWAPGRGADGGCAMSVDPSWRK